MPGSAARIQVDIRGDARERGRIEELISSIRIEAPSGSDVELTLIGDDSVLSDEHPLVVIGPPDEEVLLAAVEEGAVGYILSDATAGDVSHSLSTVAAGAAVIPPMMLGSLLRHTVERRRGIADLRRRLDVLTDREREVVEQLSLGLQRRDIAHKLFISPETVRTHIQRAMSKLGVHSQNELMALLAPLDRGRP